MLSVHQGRKKHTCDLCMKGFCTDTGIKHHKLFLHGSKVECKICGKMFGKKSLRVHIQSIHGTSKAKKLQNKKCDVCDQRFLTTYELKKHKIQAHEKFKPFSCENCEKSYAIKSLLVNHMKSAHISSISSNSI